MRCQRYLNTSLFSMFTFKVIVFLCKPWKHVGETKLCKRGLTPMYMYSNLTCPGVMPVAHKQTSSLIFKQNGTPDINWYKNASSSKKLTPFALVASDDTGYSI